MYVIEMERDDGEIFYANRHKEQKPTKDINKAFLYTSYYAARKRADFEETATNEFTINVKEYENGRICD